MNVTPDLLDGNPFEQMRLLMGDKWDDAWCVAIGPGDPRSKWFGGYAPDVLAGVRADNAVYVCVSSVAGRRVTQCVNEVRLFVLDDLGTKGDMDAALGELGLPRMMVETSPGNFTGFWVYETPLVDARVHVALMKAAIDRGLGDDLRDPTRIMRLGVGQNYKSDVKARNGGVPWDVRLDPDRMDPSRGVVDPETLAGQWGVDLSDAGLSQINVKDSVIEGSADPDNPDPWLEALSALGMTQGVPKPGVVDIRCPFMDEHTSRPETGTAYLGDGMFKCHHASCADRKSWDYRAAILDRIEEEITLGLSTGRGWLAARCFEKSGYDEDMARRLHAKGWADHEARLEKERDLVYDVWAFSTGDNRFWNLDTGESVDVMGFKVHMHGLLADYSDTGRKSADKVFLDDPRRIRVDTVTYAPGSPKITGVVNAAGQPVQAANLWRPGSTGFSPVRGVSRADVAPWLEHLEYLVPDARDRAYLLFWMAFVAQRPGQKIQWAYVLQGEQGTGKDTLFVPLWRLVGMRNVREVSMIELQSQFNSWVQAQVVVLQELGRSSRFDMAEMLKPYLAATGAGSILVNEKGVKRYPIPNVQNYLVLTNQMDALSLDETDRRYYVTCSPAQARDGSYYQALHDWMASGGAAKVAGFLLDQDIDAMSIDPSARPPMTQAKRNMMQAGLNMGQQWLLDEIEDGMFADRHVLTVREVIGGLPSHMRGKLNHRMVAEALRSIEGAFDLLEGGRARLGAERVRSVWGLRRFDLLREVAGQGPTAVGEFLKNDRAGNITSLF